MSDWWRGFFTGMVFPAIGLILSLVSLWFQRRDKLRERREKEGERTARSKAEAELRMIDRRSFDKAPYFAVAETRFNSLALEPNDPESKTILLTPKHTHLLSFFREEVADNLDAGQAVILVVENKGRHAGDLTLKLDGEDVLLKQAAVDAAAQLFVICYPFRPELRGKVQALELGFLRTDGARDVHRYAMEHGVRTLVRTDPL